MGLGRALATHVVMLLIILLVLLAVSVLGGGYRYRSWGAAGMSPAAILVVILVLLAITGRL